MRWLKDEWGDWYQEKPLPNGNKARRYAGRDVIEVVLEEPGVVTASIEEGKVEVSISTHSWSEYVRAPTESPPTDDEEE